jgi:chromosome segregation ATPase
MEQRFAEMDQHITERLDSQWDYMEARFNILDRKIGEVRAEITDLHQKFSVLQSAVDGFVLQVEQRREEQVVLRYKMNAIERNLNLVAEAAGIKLDWTP